MSCWMYASPSWSGYLNVECVSTIQKLFTKSVNGVLLVKVIRLPKYLMFMMKNWRVPWKKRLMCTDAKLRKTCLKFSSSNDSYLAEFWPHPVKEDTVEFIYQRW